MDRGHYDTRVHSSAGGAWIGVTMPPVNSSAGGAWVGVTMPLVNSSPGDPWRTRLRRRCARRFGWRCRATR
eukprot:2318738-Pyramimonas_sp.AAC.1